jgi:hypothetical protein
MTAEEIAKRLVELNGECTHDINITCGRCPICMSCTADIKDRVTLANMYLGTKESIKTGIKPNKCSCDIGLLMRNGCMCGGE